jgi:hypothetical protein
MHTLFFLEHNRVAKQLQRQRPLRRFLRTLDSKEKQDEVVFQETRRLLGGTFQAITYREYLPHVLGPAAMKKYELVTEEAEPSTYNASLNPTISNEFATFAYRLNSSIVFHVESP